MASKKAPRDYERRHFTADSIEMRADDDGLGVLDGHAAVFNRESEPIFGMFREKIAPGAFARALRESHDVRALFNHEPSLILGRAKAGTLRMSEDDTGLRVEIDLPDTNAGRDARVNVDRGDVDQMSFGFRATKESWEERGASDGLDLRTIEDVDLFDVSPVTFPAYSDTDVALRMHEAWRDAEAPSEPSPEPSSPPEPSGEGESDVSPSEEGTPGPEDTSEIERKRLLLDLDEAGE